MNNKTTLTVLGIVAIVLLLLGSLLIFGTRNRTQDNALMQTANTLYAQERYVEATQMYEQLAAEGLESRDLYFNLGNVYYMQSDFGRSILNYERAADIAPRDADVQANLATARAQVEGQIIGATPQDNPIETVAATASDWMTGNELAIVLLTVWFVFGGLLLAYRAVSAEKRTRTFKTAIAIVGIFVVLFGAAFVSQSYVDAQHTNAVVVMETVDISTGPGAQYQTTFSLYGGTDVYIQSQRGDWTQFTLPGTDVSGWIPTIAVEAV
jgi:hypothetical protein